MDDSHPALFPLPDPPEEEAAGVVPFAALAALTEVMASDWAEVMRPVTWDLHRMADFLTAERAAERPFLPAPQQVLAAFRQPLSRVRVLIVGQDPYPTPGHPVGLSFSVDRAVRPIPRSLANIYTELRADLHIPTPAHGDLSSWASQGVLLLNRVLTVQEGIPGSHQNKGWEGITELAARALARRGGPLVAVLWGREARRLRTLLGDVPIVESAHPSPLSASRGFFGSRPFSRVNRLLEGQGADPVDWRLPA